jgi:prevent-host-death family protein
MEVGAFEEKTRLSKLLDLVSKGERIVITKHGVPVAQLVPPDSRTRTDASLIIKELSGIRKRTKSGKDGIRSLITKGIAASQPGSGSQ